MLARVLATQTDGGKAVYPLGGIRVRVFAAEAYVIADGSGDYAFVHGRLTIGAGRAEAVRQSTGDQFFAALTQHFSRQSEEGGLALSLEVAEFSEAGTWKHNNLHSLLKR